MTLAKVILDDKRHRNTLPFLVGAYWLYNQDKDVMDILKYVKGIIADLGDQVRSFECCTVECQVYITPTESWYWPCASLPTFPDKDGVEQACKDHTFSRFKGPGRWEEFTEDDIRYIHVMAKLADDLNPFDEEGEEARGDEVQTREGQEVADAQGAEARAAA